MNTHNNNDRTMKRGFRGNPVTMTVTYRLALLVLFEIAFGCDVRIMIIFYILIGVFKPHTWSFKSYTLKACTPIMLCCFVHIMFVRDNVHGRTYRTNIFCLLYDVFIKKKKKKFLFNELTL